MAETRTNDNTDSMHRTHLHHHHHHSREHHRRFHLPFRAKAVLLLAFVAALVSLARIHPRIAAYCGQDGLPVVPDGKRALRVNFVWDKNISGVPREYLPRVAFIDSQPWSKESTKSKSEIDPSAAMTHKYVKGLRAATSDSAKSILDTMDDTQYYSMADSSDFPDMERRGWPKHEFDDNCVPAAQWQSNFYPVCNEIHAGTNLERALIENELTLLSNKGFWRHAWRHDDGGRNATTSDPSKITVWKTFRINHKFEEKYYEDNRVDAVSMERLTGSPYIINMYGFCGLTVVQEFAGRELAHVIDAEKLDSVQKLNLARQITQGVADIHSIQADDPSDTQPTLVHNDINLANLMFTADNRPVLNDFNIAIMSMRAKDNGSMCPFYSHFPNPQWKAPEEQVESDEESDKDPPIVDEKIDIYALGNVFYRMAAGQSPWKRPEAKKLYPDEKIEVAKLKKYNGTMPAIPEEILEKAREDIDPALAAIVDVMRLCYRFDPKTRPSAKELVVLLDEAIAKTQNVTVDWNKEDDVNSM